MNSIEDGAHAVCRTIDDTILALGCVGGIVCQLPGVLRPCALGGVTPVEYVLWPAKYSVTAMALRLDQLEQITPI